jgi:hypothetical protein
MDLIYHDAFFQHNKSTGQEFSHIINNVRDVPCETGCANYKKCASQTLECSAFRNWATSGDYKDSDVGRFVRAIKNVD